MALDGNQNQMPSDELHAYVLEHCPDLLQLLSSSVPGPNVTQTASPETVGSPASPASTFSGRTSTVSPPQTFAPVLTPTSSRPPQAVPTPVPAPAPAPAQSKPDLRPYWEHTSRAHLEPGGMLTEWPEGPLDEYNFPIMNPPPPRWGKFVSTEVERSPNGVRMYACPVRGCDSTDIYRYMLDHLKSHSPYCAYCKVPLEDESEIGAHVAMYHPFLIARR